MRPTPALTCLALVLSAAAVAQPAPDDGRVILFFAWDRPAIDGDAAARLDEVAEQLRRTPGARITVAGHADRSGPEAANLRAARLRAQAVADHLAARGVARSAMTLVSHGERQPLIPTADGVREPQNRRVEILVTPAPGA